MSKHISLDKLQDECGVFACVGNNSWPTELDVANIITLGLIGLQHRGQESTGIVTSTGNACDKFSIHKGMGLVESVFNSHILSQLNGNLGIGHTRYSTHGSSELSNCQPFVVDTKFGQISVAHNGELVNKNALRKEILNRGVGLSTGSDSELITQLLCLPLESEQNDGDWPGRLRNLMKRTPTAYSLVLLHRDKIFAARDPFGNRPLCVGRLVCSDDTDIDHNCEGQFMTEGWVVSSESCAFQSIRAEMVRELEPGEIIQVDGQGVVSIDIIPRPENGSLYPAFCIFEYVYFARPDSIFEGQMVASVRRRCGEQLALEAPVEADIISTVPESATPAAFGFSRLTKIPYDNVLAKNRYIGRTFIQPSTKLRKLAVSKKFGVLTENVAGKRIVVVDDSIVRGNTMGSIISMLRNGGAKEVHIRIASPPLRNPCYMGINIPTRKELLANQISIDETAKYLGADSLAYLSVEGLLKSVRHGIKYANEKHDTSSTNSNTEATDLELKTKNLTISGGLNSKVGHCVACLTGEYPVKLEW